MIGSDRLSPLLLSDPMGQTEREKMLANEPYLANDPELVALRLAAARQLHRFNQAAPDDGPTRSQIIANLFDTVGTNSEIYPPFHCDYGRHIKAGKNLYINVNCTILDCNWVTVSGNVLIASNSSKQRWQTSLNSTPTASPIHCI